MVLTNGALPLCTCNLPVRCLPVIVTHIQYEVLNMHVNLACVTQPVYTAIGEQTTVRGIPLSVPNTPVHAHLSRYQLNLPVRAL